MGRLGEAAAHVAPSSTGGRCTLCKWVSELDDDDRAEALQFIAGRDTNGRWLYGHAYLTRLIKHAYDRTFTDHVILTCRTNHHAATDGS